MIALGYVAVSVCVLFGIVLVIALMYMGPGDHHGDPELPVGAISQQWSPQWSPRGDYIAFSHGRGVFAIDTDGTNLRSLWPGQGDTANNLAGSPNISPDGSRIIYPVFKKGDVLPWNKDRWEVVAADSEGLNRGTLVKSRGLKASPVWSPDGSAIAYVSSEARKARHLRKPTQLFTMASDGSNVGSITPSISADHMGPPVWSPDGRSLAFVTLSFSQWGSGTLYTVAVDGSRLSRIGPTMSLPTWSADSSRIAWIRSEKPGQSAVYISGPQGSDVSKLLDGDEGFASAFTDLSWSPDGNQVLFSGKYQVGLADADGTNLKHLFNIPVKWPGVRASWSPDGSRIAVYAPAVASKEAWLIKEGLFTSRPDGGDKQVLATLTFPTGQDRTGRLQAASGASRASY